MSLSNMNSGNGYLESLADDGFATATQIVQDVGQNDFIWADNIIMDMEFANIYNGSMGLHTEYRRLPDSGGLDTVTCSVEELPWYPATRTFDGIDREAGVFNWSAYSGTNTQEWVQLNTENPQMFRGMRVCTDGYANMYSKEIRVLGSNDGVNFTELFHQANIVWPYDSELTFAWSNDTAYSHYRILVETPGTNVRYPFGEVYYFAAEIGSPDLLETDTQIINGDKLVIVKNDNSIHELVASGVIFTPGGLEPSKATSNHTSSLASTGIVYQSSYYLNNASYAGWKTFDGNEVGTQWISANSNNEWVKYGFSSNVRIGKIRHVNALGQQPKNIRYEISDDNVNWTVIHTYLQAINEASHEYILPVPLTAKWFRIYIEDGYYGQLSIMEIEITGYIPDQIQMDTSAITIGEKPSKTYRVKSGIKFNNVAAAEVSDSFSVGTTLQSSKTFDKTFLNSPTIDLEVSTVKGNKITAINYDLYIT